MGKSGLIVTIIVVLALLVGGGVALSRKSNTTPSTPSTASNTSSNTPSSSTTTPSNTTNNSQTNTSQSGAQVITYGNNGFSPSTLTVKAGGQVTIKNASSNPLQFDSDPHPSHTNDPELNVGTISPGESKTITVTKTGSHGYHNHLDPTDTGTLVVQ